MSGMQTSLILPPVQEELLAQADLAAATLRVLGERQDHLTPDEICLLGDAQWASGDLDAAAATYESARSMTTRSRPEPLALQPALIRRYLDTMERIIVGYIYEDPSQDKWGEKKFDRRRRESGRDWPLMAHTMIGEKRLRNLRVLTETVIIDQIPGDLIETGVWRGGACILMRAVLAAYGITDRRVFVADSFAGLPPPDAATYPADAGDDHHTYAELAVSQQEVAGYFAKYDLLDEQVVFLEGWFKDTLPRAPISQLAILRLDGDMYQSTMEALSALYGRLSPGGFCIVDDGNVPGCQRAIMDFRMAEGITAPVIDIDGWGFYWRKQ